MNNSKIESVEVILSKKDEDSIFEEEACIEKETHGLHGDHKKWIQENSEYLTNYPNHNENQDDPKIFDESCKEFSSKFEIFMEAPVCMDCGKMIGARMQKCSNLNEYDGDFKYLYSLYKSKDGYTIRIGIQNHQFDSFIGSL